MGAIARGVGGYYLGSSIGGYLGKDDKQKMAEASQRAYETEQPQTFSNAESGVNGKAEVVQASQQGDSRGCKTIRQTVVLKDGQTVRRISKAARTAVEHRAPSGAALTTLICRSIRKEGARKRNGGK